MYEYSSVPAAREALRRARFERAMTFRAVFARLFARRRETAPACA